jgi:hypothetical protein
MADDFICKIFWSKDGFDQNFLIGQLYRGPSKAEGMMFSLPPDATIEDAERRAKQLWPTAKIENPKNEPAKPTPVSDK